MRSREGRKKFRLQVWYLSRPQYQVIDIRTRSEHIKRRCMWKYKLIDSRSRHPRDHAEINLGLYLLDSVSGFV